MFALLSDFVKVKELLGKFVPNFGTNQAKIVSVLLLGEVKTARDIADEIKIPLNKAYPALNQLVSKGFMVATSTVPTQYSIGDLRESCERFAKRRIKELEAFPETAKQLTLIESEESDNLHYVVQIKGKEAKLYNQTTKTIVDDPYEVKQLKRVLEGLEREKVIESATS